MKVAVWGQGPFFECGLKYLEDSGYTVSDNADLLVCLAYPRILQKAELKQWPQGVLNFHIGLPNYRGRHPLQWMLIEGEDRITCQIHYMDEGIDTGDIIEESSFSVTRNETYDSALAKVVDQIGPLLVAALYKIEHGKVVRQKQPTGRYWPKRTPADSEFTFDQPSLRVHRFINAMSGSMPTAFTGSNKWKRSHIGERPGQIVNTHGKLVIATRDGVVLVEPV